jgi:hypothetical protein
MNRSFRNDNKGQVIVITALLIALMILSTFVYVTAIIKQAPTIESNQFDVFPQYQQSLRNTLISSLANVTNNGTSQILNENIGKLNQIFSSHYYESMLEINCTLSNVVPYQNGLWISGPQENHAVVGAKASYQLSSIGNSKISNNAGIVNIISEAYLSGNSLQINETAKQVTLTAQVLNEGVPTLAAGFTCYYQNGAVLIKTEAFNVTDFGNGTYRIVFSAQSSPSSEPLVASMNIIDHRGIIVSVNTTCVNL